ncbi:MAG: hypothetical protein COB50_04035 [Thiotrichales bacterium]|nr:MAG: hypothetical protein COB50_04035 [Thiotrichales bacterium]
MQTKIISFIQKNFPFLKMGKYAVAVCSLVFLTSDINYASTHIHLVRYSYSHLPNWSKGSQHSALPSIRTSCRKILQTHYFFRYGKAQFYKHWKRSCKHLLKAKHTRSNSKARKIIENNFTPYLVTTRKQHTGLFTGYYIPIVKGSKYYSKYYNIPMYAVPKCHSYQRLCPRHMSRKTIVRYHKLPNTKVFAWVHGRINRFFLEIQGSGIIVFENGKKIMLAYAGQNGKPYYPIGRYLLKMGYLSREQISMQSMKLWLLKHPGSIDTILNKNASFVFFRKLHHTNPTGAAGVTLIRKRSLAVDRKFIPLGSMLWLDTEIPRVGNYAESKKWQHLLVAQDTGGAIKGAVRGDIFFGVGKIAESQAGNMRASGRYWIFLPKGKSSLRSFYHLL